MPRPPKTFEKLKQQWYDKLKKAGFEDIEDEDGQLTSYDNASSKYFKDRHLYDQLKRQTQEEQHQIAVEATTRYYQLASQFLYSHNFKTELDKLVWEYHSLGSSRRQIAKLVSTRSKNIPEWRVRTILDRLQNIMLGGVDS